MKELKFIKKRKFDKKYFKYANIYMTDFSISDSFPDMYK